jgi:Ca2+-binding RTX toxin-like protein
MGNAKNVIKALMRTLDDTSLSGVAALDEAIRACSSYTGTQDLINHFVSDCRNAGSSNTFLLDKCGINLNNADTGAISGLDAGGTVEKNAEDIIYEPVSNTNIYNYPNANTQSCIDGIIIKWPGQYYSKSEEEMMAGPFHWWIDSALKRIEDDYGLSFTESGSSARYIRFSFYDVNPDNTGGINLANTGGGIINRQGQACDGYCNSNGLSDYINININRLAFNKNYHIYKNYTNGNASGYSQYTDNYGHVHTPEFWDRTITHELVHALMKSNIKRMNDLPQFFTEGSAELIHGIDDTRRYNIERLAANADLLANNLSLDPGTGNDDSYAAGYMLLRYLGKQAAIGIPAGTSYSSDYKTLKGGSSFGGNVLWLSSQSGYEYKASTQAIDASAVDHNLVLAGRNGENDTLIGGAGKNDIWGGGSGNDILTGGTGVNTYWFGAGDDCDTVTDFHSGRDNVYWYTGALTGITTSGTDVILHSGDSMLDIKGMAGKKLNLAVPGAAINTIIGQQDKENTMTYDDSIAYYSGSQSHTDTLEVNQATAISLANNLGRFYVDIDNIDASRATGKMTIIGSNGNNVITAGQGGSDIWGSFGGNDTMIGGSGQDTFWYGSGDGTDTIKNASAMDTIFIYDPAFNCSSLAMQGNDLVIGNAKGGSLAVDDWNGTINLRLADNSEYTLNRNGSGSIVATAK